MNFIEFCDSNFLDRHLLCGDRGRRGGSHRPKELPALLGTRDAFETFAEVTVTCAVCRISMSFTIDRLVDAEAWQCVFSGRRM